MLSIEDMIISKGNGDGKEKQGFQHLPDECASTPKMLSGARQELFLAHHWSCFPLKKRDV